MRILLIGYGKMGKAILPIAEAHGHQVTAADSKQFAGLTAPELKQFDVAIEFTRPDAAFANVCRCLNAGLPVVCGTTGWKSQLADAESLCRNTGSALLVSSNFSLGVNLFFYLSGAMAHLLDKFPEYQAEIYEEHHLAKKDAPSGTAITTAERVLSQLSSKSDWALVPAGEKPVPGVLPITAERTGDVPGTHILRFNSPEDNLELTHTAHNRNGFAAGSVMAAEWLADKKGVFTMPEVLGLPDFTGF